MDYLKDILQATHETLSFIAGMDSLAFCAG